MALAAASKNAWLGLPTIVAVRPVAYSSAATNAPASRASLTGFPIAVSLKRDELGTPHNLKERPVEPIEIPRGPEVPDDNRFGRSVAILQRAKSARVASGTQSATLWMPIEPRHGCEGRIPLPG